MILLSLGCAPPTPPVSGVGNGSAAVSTLAPAAASQPSRTLVTAIRVEPSTLASRLGQGGGATLTTTRRMFNAYLVLFDQRGEPQPYLAAELPQINTQSWRLSADGRMETTYKLRPNLIWHDGAALTAEDFVFAWKVFSSPALGFANAVPTSLMEEVLAPDPLTLTIRWKSPHAGAGILTEEFPPLPRHVLESASQTASPDQFAAHPYWTQQFLGAGPFRLEHWEPGVSLEGVAFDRHVLGAPKISRVRLVFISDPNAALANLLAGEVQFTADDSIRFQQGLILQREWGPRNGGSVLVKPDLWRSVFVQFRPEILATPGLADIRVRKALALTMDKEGLNEALFEGQGIIADVPFIPRTMSYYSTIEPLVAKYSFNPGQAQALLSQAGYARGGDGVWASPTAGRLAFGLLTTASSQNESELSILAAGWRQAGFEVSESIMPAAQAQDGQARSSFPGLLAQSIPLGEETLAAAGSAGYSGPENRWTGRNRGGWTHAEFDRFAEAFTSSLDPQQRVQAIGQMVRIFGDELPTISMYFNPIPVAHVSALSGPQLVAPNADIAWNIHQWELR